MYPEQLYRSAVLLLVWARAIMGDGADEGRWIPSPNDMMLNYQQAVTNEDRLRAASYAANLDLAANPAVVYAMKKGTEHAPGRNEMLGFAEAFNARDWKAALADPAAKAAMRRVRDRVASLKEEGMAIVNNRLVPPNVGSRLINERVRVPVKHEFFSSSTFNPLESSHPTRGWDPRVRPWPGRKIQRHEGQPDPTSYWVASWVPSDLDIDPNFQCVRPEDITQEAREKKKTLHGKAFR